MPSFSGRLTEGQGNELVSVIRAFNPQPRPQQTLTTEEFNQRFQALERELEFLQREFRRVSLHRHSRVLGSFDSRAPWSGP